MLATAKASPTGSASAESPEAVLVDRPADRGMNRGLKLLCVAGGTVAVAVGIVGAFVPLLPTTPFLLLAAFLYARGSERLYRRLVGARWVGDYLRRYYEHRCMSRRHKVFTLVFLWTVLALSAIYAVDAGWERGLLGAVGAGVTIHLLRIPSDPGTPPGHRCASNGPPEP